MALFFPSPFPPAVPVERYPPWRQPALAGSPLSLANRGARAAPPHWLGQGLGVCVPQPFCTYGTQGTLFTYPFGPCLEPFCSSAGHSGIGPDCLAPVLDACLLLPPSRVSPFPIDAIPLFQATGFDVAVAGRGADSRVVWVLFLLRCIGT